ncbi:MAG TPA: methylated-DNA--[protein]-cysteine S-methyltransferase [Terriglobales bacterium]|nr:methylated-DNA--[protein]-cysteine S-methyltransferase [Terriglobales bacterium]
METLHYCRVPSSPVGPLLLAASERGLALLEFDRGVFPSRNAHFAAATWKESAGKLRPYVRDLEQYFAGKRRNFSSALDLRGTDFQRRCWQALLEIPFGETRTYAQIAERVGQPRGFRAVGMANHDNPVAIVVPCHRVIASDGTLGGYGGGLPAKRWLLELEGIKFEEQLKLFRVAGVA